MQQLTLIRTHSDNPDFTMLVAQLDADLRIKDGEEHSFFAQFNKSDSLKHIVIAYAEGKPVGCGALKQTDDHTGEIKRMFTLPSVRGKGVATSILRELEVLAVESGFKTCILETGKNNPEAIRLYQKASFREIPNYGPYKGVDSSICFSKDVF